MRQQSTTSTACSNRVTLVGRVTREPQDRVLPSGTEISTVRISVPRERTTMTKGSKQTSDWFDCTAWSATMRRRIAAWSVGDEVEVTGSMRRRHLGAAGGGTSMVDIELLEARRPRDVRAGAAQSPGADTR